MRWIAIGAMLMLTLAGCTSGTDGTGDGNTATTPPPALMMPEDPMPEGDGHDHTNPAEHKFLWNYQFSGRDPLGQNAANAAGLHALDVQADHLFGAIYGSHAAGVDGGLAIWSLEDPSNPNLVGQYRVQGAVGGDRSMEATDDGEFVVLATEPVTCFGQVGTNQFSAHLIDVRDKANPVLADGLTIAGPVLGSPTSTSGPLSIHSVVVHRFGEEDYAFLMGDVYLIDRTGPTGAQLVPTGASINVGHDLYIRDTPWGTTWALSANGGNNFQIYDVTNPVEPKEIAVWEGDGVRYLHTADVAFFGDQAVVVLSSEDWEDHPSYMWVFDGSALKDHNVDGDPMVLTPEYTWNNPGNHTALGLSFSLHNPRFGEDGILSISSYHGGLWQLDFRAEHQRFAPEPIGYAVYAEGTPPVTEDPVYDAVETNLCGLGITLDTPTYMDVELGPGGILYAADVYMGLYTFTPAAEHPVYGTA